MIHYIIVKFNDTVTDKQAMCLQIEALFLPAAKMPGIHSIQLHTTCIDRPNGAVRVAFLHRLRL